MVPAPRLKTAILTGTTASGKTSIALDFARKRPDVEIINADSLLVYRGFDIGTAKPGAAELAAVPHHLIDIRDADEAFTAGDFVRECERIRDGIHQRGKRALVVGGTGFYLKALLFGLWDAPRAPAELRAELSALSDRELFDRLLSVDETAATRITPGDRYRLIRALETVTTTGKTPTQLEEEAHARGSNPGYCLLVTDRSPSELERRISERTADMLRHGFLEEVERLRDRYAGSRPLASVGYAQAIRYLEGRPPAGRRVSEGLAGLRDEIELATRQLAKRQRTWFRGQFKRLENLNFFTLEADREKLERVLQETYSL